MNDDSLGRALTEHAAEWDEGWSWGDMFGSALFWVLEHTQDWDEGSSGVYLLGWVLVVLVELAIAILAGAFWHFLFLCAGLVFMVAAIIVGFVRIRRGQAQSSPLGGN